MNLIVGIDNWAEDRNGLRLFVLIELGQTMKKYTKLFLAGLSSMAVSTLCALPFSTVWFVIDRHPLGLVPIFVAFSIGAGICLETYGENEVARFIARHPEVKLEHHEYQIVIGRPEERL